MRELTIVRPDTYSHIPTSKTFLDAAEYSRSRQISRLPGACPFWISFESSQVCFSDSSDFHGRLMTFFSWPFIPSWSSWTMNQSGVLIRCISQYINPSTLALRQELEAQQFWPGFSARPEYRNRREVSIAQ